MARLFGTDGVRGLANRDITAKLALQLSVAASRVPRQRVQQRVALGRERDPHAPARGVNGAEIDCERHNEARDALSAIAEFVTIRDF